MTWTQEDIDKLLAAEPSDYKPRPIWKRENGQFFIRNLDGGDYKPCSIWGIVGWYKRLTVYVVSMTTLNALVWLCGDNKRNVYTFLTVLTLLAGSFFVWGIWGFVRG